MEVAVKLLASDGRVWYGRKTKVKGWSVSRRTLGFGDRSLAWEPERGRRCRMRIGTEQQRDFSNQIVPWTFFEDLASNRGDAIRGEI